MVSTDTHLSPVNPPYNLTESQPELNLTSKTSRLDGSGPPLSEDLQVRRNGIHAERLEWNTLLHLEVQSPGSFDISSLSSVQQASSVRSLTVPVVSSSCLFFLPASGLKKKLRYLHPVGVAIHIVQWQFYLQPLRVILHPLSIQQSQGQKDLTQVGAKDRQKARVFRAYPFLSGTKEKSVRRLSVGKAKVDVRLRYVSYLDFGHQECSSSIGGTIERPL
ncbi:unnamed protein product [Vicia faba]|uniref:Uncharacterized protein n=1 Tax=Vicia faba TaxID=3906 RepID=A0AAV1BA26_VICFA|nr:unnamed protein product [Vicia faba]